MDNIFEILIYIFIIVSFLSSLFRKKKKRETATGQQTARPPLEPESQSKPSQQEEYDLLKEIEKMFKTEPTTSSQKEDEIRFKEEERFEPDSKYAGTSDWQDQSQADLKTIHSEPGFESWEDKAKKAEVKRKTINEKIIKQAEMFEKNLRKKKVEHEDVKKTIRQKFKQPGSLKEYVLISELLGKPKALSRESFGQE